MADSSVIFSTALDNKQLEKDLIRTKKEIEKLARAAAGQELKKSPLIQQAQELEQKIKAARAEAEKYRADWAAGVAGADQNQSAAISRAQELESAHAKVVSQIDKVDAKLLPAYEKLEAMKEKAGGIEAELAAAGAGAGRMGQALSTAGDYMEKFTDRVKRLARRVLIFSVITAALRQMRVWMSKVVKTNEEASFAIARLKGSLLTLAQPLVNVIIPALTVLVNILTKVISLIANIVSKLFGATAEESAEAAKNLYDETSALDGVGNAAKKAQKSLASFDEINQLSNSGADSGGGAAGSSSAEAIAPDFSFLDMADERLEKIAEAVLAIGSGLALWKLSSLLPEQLGAVIGKLAGIAIAAGGLMLMWDGLKDAWENGVDWGNVMEMIGGAAAVAAGLYLAFGNVGAGIGLVVSGLAMLVTGFRDVMENGANLQNTLLIIAGIIAAGLGIALLTGSLIPALVAGIMSVIYAIVAWQGNAEELAANLQLILGGIVDFIAGVFTGNWERAWKGVKDVFRGLINSVIIIFESVVNGIIAGLNFLIDKINSLSWEIPEWVPGIGGETFGFHVPKIPKLSLPRVPELAAGAVIPPNREFLAVLGDQKSGTNIETPLSTMVQAFKQALNDSGYSGGGVIENVVLLDGEVIYRNQQKIARRHGMSLARG